MGTPHVVDALTGQGVRPAANPIGAMQRLYADMDDDVRLPAQAAIHQNERVPDGRSRSPCLGRSSAIWRYDVIRRAEP